jgi:hypothetical protein
MSHVFAGPRLNHCQRRGLRHKERTAIRGQVYRCFCEGRGVPEDLFQKAVSLNIFAGQPAMSEKEAVNLVTVSSGLSRKEQRKNRFLFQAWFIIGNKRFWSLIRNFRIANAMSFGTHVRREAPSVSYHMTARRCENGHAAFCPQIVCCI